MNYDFKINDFEGPLDLLLHLIKVNEMDIMNIQIEKITDQYVEYINSLEKMNIEVASEYLVMASELIHIKSKLLLPNETIESEDEEEINSKEELINRLLEYDAYKKISNILEEKNENRSLIYTKLPENINNYIDDKPIEQNGEIDDLVNAFKLFLERNKKNKPLKTKVTVNEISITKRCDDIRNVLKSNKKVSFFKLFEYNSKDYIVVTFLAILEMCKNKELTISQDDTFGDIVVESV
ncbi:MAG: segregation/condensation protein A [Bacilli bacterium]|nr:segregation/condensation protein A [Bacilli bacterium]